MLETVKNAWHIHIHIYIHITSIRVAAWKGVSAITKLSVRPTQSQSILQISTWLTGSFSLWDGQPWIKRTWSLIMHSSVMQPSVATNLDTESSPGFLSALLGIYGFPYRWFTPHSAGVWGWREGGGGGWGRGQVPLSQGLDLSISHGRPCLCTRATSEHSGHYRRRARAFLSWCRNRGKVMRQVKCARLRDTTRDKTKGWKWM